MKNKILTIITFIIFCSCSQDYLNNNKLLYLLDTFKHLKNNNYRYYDGEDILKLQAKNPHFRLLKEELQSFNDSALKIRKFFEKYKDQKIYDLEKAQEEKTDENKKQYIKYCKQKTFITYEKSDNIAKELILYLEYLQKKYNHLRTDTLFKGFLKKENKQEFFYQYYFENTSVIESLIALEEVKFILSQYQQECIYAISQKYLEKGNLTRIEILNKKEKYQIGDTILLGLKGGFPKIKTITKACIDTSCVNEFPKNTWHYIVPKNIHIGKNNLHTNIKCIRENQQDTIFFRNFLFEVTNK